MSNTSNTRVPSRVRGADKERITRYEAVLVRPCKSLATGITFVPRAESSESGTIGENAPGLSSETRYLR